MLRTTMHLKMLITEVVGRIWEEKQPIIDA
jgi:hypothetical protein